MVRTSNPEVTGLSLALIAKLELFLSRPDFNISAMFVNSQLVCLSPAGTFNHVLLCSFALITFFIIWLFKFTLFSWLACASCDRFDFRTMKDVFQTINQNTRNWLNSKIIFCSQHIIRTEIGQFRYIKIQPKTIDLRTRLWGVTTEIVGFIPRAIVLSWIIGLFPCYWITFSLFLQSECSCSSFHINLRFHSHTN